MNTEQMREIINSRISKMEQVRAKVDHIYSRTEDMFKALDNGADKDLCFTHWVELFNADMSDFDRAEVAYYNAVCGGLVGLVDDFMKFKEVAK